MDGIYANIWGILMVNVTIYGIHGSYGYWYLISYNIIPIDIQNVGNIDDILNYTLVLHTPFENPIDIDI